MPKCSACQEEKPTDQFTRKQLKRGQTKARCIACVEAKRPSVAVAPPAGRGRGAPAGRGRGAPVGAGRGAPVPRGRGPVARGPAPVSVGPPVPGVVAAPRPVAPVAAPAPPVEKVVVRPVAPGGVLCSKMAPAYPKRPVAGPQPRGATTVKLAANHFPVSLRAPERAAIHHYNVVFSELSGDAALAPDTMTPMEEAMLAAGLEGEDASPAAPKGGRGAKDAPRELPRRLRISIMAHLEATQGAVLFSGAHPAFDGQCNLYSVAPFPQDGMVITMELPPDADEGAGPKGPPKFKIEIRKVQEHAMSALVEYFRRGGQIPQVVIQAIDVAARTTAARVHSIVGASVFAGDRCTPIGLGCDVWLGYFMSARPTQSGMTMNVDTAAATFFHPGPVTSYVADFLGMRPADMGRRDPRSGLAIHPGAIDSLSKSLRNLKVKTTHTVPGRSFRIKGVSKVAADRQMFDMDGRKVSVADYFKRTYKPLKFPGMPCLVVGSDKRPIHMPMEVCCISSGQRRMRRLEPSQAMGMIKATCKKPAARFADLKTSLAGARLKDDPCLHSFGVRVDAEPVAVTGTILPPPTLHYDRDFRPRAGQWDMRGLGLHRAVQLQSYAIINCSRLPDHAIGRFFETFCKCYNEKMPRGTRPCTPGAPIFRARSVRDVETAYRRAIEGAGSHFHFQCQCVFVVKDGQDVPFYTEIKRLSDTVTGVPSQCLLSKHVGRPNMKYCANVCLKVNVKIGGVTAIIPGKLCRLFDRPTIVFGADVTHPSPGDDARPSIAAVVASLDVAAVEYASMMKAQGHRVEIIADLQNMSIELLRRFQARNGGLLPARVLFYRDGVSEGQFDAVLDNELSALKRGLAVLGGDEYANNTPITFICVQKRHHTRFVPLGRPTERSGNIPPGTVVDSGICHPHLFDFYLCSHAGIQGTSRPCLYSVLWDENKFKARELQELSYKMCYTFQRCTSSVSMVPAAYYAHLVAFRARYLSGAEGSDSMSVVSGVSADIPDLPIHDACGSKMYFM